MFEDGEDGEGVDGKNNPKEYKTQVDLVAKQPEEPSPGDKTPPTNVIPKLFGGAKQLHMLFGSLITSKPADGEDGEGVDGNNNPKEYEPQVDLVAKQPEEPSPGDNTPPNSLPAFGAKSLPGFGDIAKNSLNGGFMFGRKPAENKASPFSAYVIPQLFGGAKQSLMLFGSLITSKPADGEDGEDVDGNNNPKEYEPQVDFKPILALKEVEVKTVEDILFKERCQLYIFDPETKEWKKKGVGEIKIFIHQESSAYRVLTRRDQVLKLCANHRIYQKLK